MSPASDSRASGSRTARPGTSQLAKAVDVPARRINEIVHGQRRITADTALRLSRYFGTSERFWLNLQTRYGAAYTLSVSSRPLWSARGASRADVIERGPVPGVVKGF